MGNCKSTNVADEPNVTYVKVEDTFEVGPELGSGAFSTVRRATHKEDGSVVALKMIPNTIFAKNRESTEREVAVLKQVSDHPNIVRLHEVFRTKKHFVISMELLTGGELFDRICEKDKYSEEDARKIVVQLTSAVAFLHEKNIAHRDLKPENAIFATESEDSVLKVSDFGFANVYDPDNQFVATCGTPLYVAPEILDQVPYDVQCDMWSLGVIVYILLCGFPPFFGDDDDELFYQIRHGIYEFMSPNWDHISNNAKDFIRACFVLTPHKRITAQQALQHAWLASVTNDTNMAQTLHELKRTQCKRKLIKGVHAVIAMNRMKRASN